MSSRPSHHLVLRRVATLLTALLPLLWLLVAQPSAWATSFTVKTHVTTVSRPVSGSAVLTLPVTASHVAAYWHGAPNARVLMSWSTDGRTFTPVMDAGRDEVGEQRHNGMTYGAVRVTPSARFVRITTDRPLGTVWVDGMSDGERVEHRTRQDASAGAAVAQPSVSPRSAWGADESLRFNADGTLKQAPTYHATKKLIVHHTDTTNADPDPAATVRAIYRYHVVTQGWADIGYNFLLDESGRTWEGRWSRDYAAGVSPSGDDEQGRGVTGSHTGGWNSGTVGIALLGNLMDRDASPAARTGLVDLLAWAAERAGLDPRATSTFVNPVSGATVTTPNIAGHKDYTATDCPGGSFYATLPRLRDEVAARIAGTTATPAPATDTTAPSVPTGLTATGGARSVSLAWAASTDDTAVTGYAVLRSSNGKPGTFSQIATTQSTSFTDTGLRSGKTLWYRVQATDAAGNRSAQSASSSATVR